MKVRCNFDLELGASAVALWTELYGSRDCESGIASRPRNWLDYEMRGTVAEVQMLAVTIAEALSVRRDGGLVSRSFGVLDSAKTFNFVTDGASTDFYIDVKYYYDVASGKMKLLSYLEYIYKMAQSDLKRYHISSTKLTASNT